MTSFRGRAFIYILAVVMSSLFLNACGTDQKPEAYAPEPSLPVEAGAARRAITVSSGVDAGPEIFVQMGHADSGYTSNTVAVFTPDGRFVLTGGEDGTVRLWETESGREIRTFRCLKGVTHIAVSQDGRFMVSGDRFYGSNVNVWQIATGEKLRSFSIEVLNGPPVVFLDNGDRVLAGGKDGLMRLWDVSSGALIREYTAAIDGEVSALVLTPEGNRAIAAYSTQGGTSPGAVTTIGVWDIGTGETFLSFNNTGTQTVALGITPDGSQVLSADWGQDSVRLWNAQTGAPVKSIVTGGTSAIAVSAGGRYALLGGYMNFRLVELATGKEIRKIEQGIRDWVQSIAFSPDGRYALVGDQVPQPKLWDLTSGSQVRALGGYAGQTLAARTARQDNLLMTAHGYSNSAGLWDDRNGIQTGRIQNDPGSLATAAALSPDGTKVAFSGWEMAAENAYLSIWDTGTGKRIMKIQPPGKTSIHARAPVFTSDGRRIIWALGAEVIVSSLPDGGEVKRFRWGSSDIYRMRLDPSQRYLLAYDDLRHSHLVDLATGGVLKTFTSATCAFSADGKKVYTLAIVSENTAALKETDLQTLAEKPLAEVGFNAAVRAGDLSMANYIESLIAGPDGGALYFYDSFNHDIYRIDLKKGAIAARFKGHSSDIISIDTTPDGAFLCSGSQDGTTRFWDPESGREMAKFIGFSDGEWIVITPEGYFNASASGAKYLNVRVGSQVYSIDNFYEKYYNPAYVAAVLQGKNVAPAADIRQGVALPPEVAIVSPAMAAEFKNDEIQITVSAEDMGGGIDEIRLYHNGKAVGEDTRSVQAAPDERRRQKTYAVTLVDGANRFRAVGFSRDRTESNPSEITVTLAAPIKKVSLHVLAVGINRYKNPALNLNYAEPDARGIAEFFSRRGAELFKESEVTGVYNEQATKAAVVARLRALAQTKPQDAVLIYLAGHGESIDEKWYFIPYDLTYPERADEVREKGVSSEELSGLIRNIAAQKVLVLIDACKSGAVLVAFRGFEDRKALSQLSRAAGVHVVAASSKDQFAAEVKELGHGVFTYTLLEGLNGKAAGKGETVTVRKLMGYVEEELPALTQKYRQEAQYPVVDSKGMDFPLVKGR